MAVYVPLVPTPGRLFGGFYATDSVIITPRLAHRRRRTTENPFKATPWCGGTPPIRFQHQYFQMVQQAWRQGFGYPWGDTSYAAIPFNKADWRAQAASFQYKKQNGRLKSLTGHQWFTAYQLAALSANFRYANVGVFRNPRTPLLFTAAPDGSYNPPALTSAVITSFISPNPLDPSPVLMVTTAPDYGQNNTTNINPLSGPILVHNVSPPRPPNSNRGKRQWYWNFTCPYKNQFTVASSPGNEIQNSSFACFGDPSNCWHQFYAVRTTGTWTAHSFTFGVPIPCQEPGPILYVFGPSQAV